MSGMGGNRTESMSASSPSTAETAALGPEVGHSMSVESLAAMPKTGGSGDLDKTLELIAGVARSPKRADAVVAMVKMAASEFPGSVVRCGIGNNRLRRIFDGRLGWLASSSDMFKLAASRWDDDDASLPTAQASQASIRSGQESDRCIRLNIDDEVGLGRCVLWIEGVDLNTADRQWIRRALPTLRAILWRRTGGIPGEMARSVTTSAGGTRIYILLGLLAVLLLAIWPVAYRVRCSTVVRPDHSRIIAAPFDAVLESAHVEPGDSVSAGQPLITLDGSPLRIELQGLQAQIGQIDKEKDIATVSGRIAEAQQAGLKIRELNRRRDLIQRRLDRLIVTSPIDGILVSGDLNRSIGSPLEMGQAVMEVSPLDQMVIELEIPEYEISYVEAGTEVRVRLASGQGEWIAAKIDGIYPSAEIREDQNVFIARIDVPNPDGSLRPGMHGDAIAYGPIRPWLWSVAKSGWERLLWWVGY